MTSGWIATLNPEDNLVKVAKLFSEYNYDGFPVVDKDNKLQGVVTSYELIKDSDTRHFSGLRDILKKVEDNLAGDQDVQDHFKKLESIKTKDIMNAEPLVITPEKTLEELAEQFSEHHRVNPIPVVDENKKLVGVVSRIDLIRFFDHQYLYKILISTGNEMLLQKLGKHKNDVE